MHSLFHALLVMPGCQGECECECVRLISEPCFFSSDSIWQTGPCDHRVYLTVSLSLFFLSLYCSSPVRPAETANRVPALYRQSNQRPTSLKPTSTSCRLSLHVSPNVPASSSPRSTVYRSVWDKLDPQMYKNVSIWQSWVFHLQCLLRSYDMKSCWETRKHIHSSRSIFNEVIVHDNKGQRVIFSGVTSCLCVCFSLHVCVCRSW